jgi:NADH-quinone oxidoreductase subunit L
VAFGIFNAFPIDGLIAPALGNSIHQAHSFAGFPKNMTLVMITGIVLVAAFLNHIYGVKKTGKGLGAVDHIHHAPGLSWAYDNAERGRFDPYNFGRIMINIGAIILSFLDKITDFFYNKAAVWAANGVSLSIRKAHNGSHKMYIAWVFLGTAIIIAFLMRTM